MTTNSPAASVIIPTFNRSNLLVRAIESVLNQTFQDFELIVVDDESTDATEKVFTAIKNPRVRYVKRSNGGISAARNTGLSLATGLWVTFLDDDDQVLPEWLASFHSIFSDSEVGIACMGALIHSGGNGSPLLVLPKQLSAVYERVRGLFRAGTFAVRRNILAEAGGFAEGLLCSHATELALRMIPICHRHGLKVRSVNHAFVQINRPDPYNRPMSSPTCLLQGTNYLLQNHGHIIKRSPAALARYLMIAGVAASRLGLHHESRKYFARALVTHPWNPKTYLRFFVSLNRYVANFVWQSRYLSDDSVGLA